jgi:hypothetical protein
MKTTRSACVLIVKLALILLLGTASTSILAVQTYKAVSETAIANTWPGADGLIGTADDTVSENNSPMSNSLPNANGSHSYNAFDFGSGLTDAPLLPDGMNAITFLEGTVSIDESVAANGGGPLFTAWVVAGTEPFAGHGDYDGRATATNSGSYDPTTGEFTQNFDFSLNLLGGTAIATNFEMSGIAHVVSSTQYATGIGNNYVDTVLIPLAQSRGALGFIYTNASGVVPASSGGTGGTFPSMPIQAVLVAFIENPDPWTGLWWAGQAESGWGMTLTEQVDVIFATIFTYDTSGMPVWYVASLCQISGDMCTGALYRVTGGAPLTGEWMGTDAAVQVGTLTITFSDINNAMMEFTIDGVSGSKAIVRQVWQPVTPGATMTALWFKASESGWGLTVVRQADIAFITLYTYLPSGLPTWYVASRCDIVGNGCTGTLYSVTGGSALTEPWAGPVTVDEAGSITLDFSDSNNGTMDVVITDLAGNKMIERQIWRNGATYTEVQGIFDASCIACHGSSGGLSLAAGESYFNLLDVDSNAMPGTVRVKRWDPDNSYLVIKLEGAPTHPPTGVLPAGELTKMRNWILDGAIP